MGETFIVHFETAIYDSTSIYRCTGVKYQIFWKIEALALAFCFDSLSYGRKLLGFITAFCRASVTTFVNCLRIRRIFYILSAFSRKNWSPRSCDSFGLTFVWEKGYRGLFKHSIHPQPAIFTLVTEFFAFFAFYQWWHILLEKIQATFHSLWNFWWFKYRKKCDYA